MHKEILTSRQQELLPLIKIISNEFGLVGGTAIALQIGHRESLDFDFFKRGTLNILKIKRTINDFFPITSVKVENPDEYTLVVNGIQMTFYNYPFDISYSVPLENTTLVPNLLTLAAMKAYALGKRAKWKDYVDLYFILRQHTLGQIISTSDHIYNGEFSEKLFREQLSYYEDIDYSETVSYLKGFEVEDSEIKKQLLKVSLT